MKNNTTDPRIAKNAVKLRMEISTLDGDSITHGASVAADLAGRGVDHDAAVSQGVQAAQKHGRVKLATLAGWALPVVALIGFIYLYATPASASTEYLTYIPNAQRSQVASSSWSVTATPTPELYPPPQVLPTATEEVIHG